MELWQYKIGEYRTYSRLHLIEWQLRGLLANAQKSNESKWWTGAPIHSASTQGTAPLSGRCCLQPALTRHLVSNYEFAWIPVAGRHIRRRDAHRQNIIVVDAEIDPANMTEVLCALGTRCDPASRMDFLSNWTSQASDPRINPDKRKILDFICSSVLIDARKP